MLKNSVGICPPLAAQDLLVLVLARVVKSLKNLVLHPGVGAAEATTETLSDKQRTSAPEMTAWQDLTN